MSLFAGRRIHSYMNCNYTAARFPLNADRCSLQTSGQFSVA